MIGCVDRVYREGVWIGCHVTSLSRRPTHPQLGACDGVGQIRTPLGGPQGGFRRGMRAVPKARGGGGGAVVHLLTEGWMEWLLKWVRVVDFVSVERV